MRQQLRFPTRYKSAFIVIIFSFIFTLGSLGLYYHSTINATKDQVDNAFNSMITACKDHEESLLPESVIEGENKSEKREICLRITSDMKKAFNDRVDNGFDVDASYLLAIGMVFDSNNNFNLLQKMHIYQFANRNLKYYLCENYQPAVVLLLNLPDPKAAITQYGKATVEYDRNHYIDWGCAEKITQLDELYAEVIFKANGV